MKAKPEYAKPRSISVLMALRILFLLGFLLGCLFAQTSQTVLKPVSGSVWFRGPFETGTDFPSVFSAFLFDSLFYALPIFLFGMTFLGVLVIPAAISLKGFTLGTSLTALVQLEGTGPYLRRWFDYLPMAVLCVTVLLLLAVEAFRTARRSCGAFFGNGEPLPVKRCTVQFLLAFAALVLISVLYCVLHVLILQI